jgi:hypothetical protein
MVLRMDTEWLFDSTTGWFDFYAVSFDVQVSLFTSQANYTNGIAYSTNTTNYSATSGNWGYGSYGPGTGRVWGSREIQLPQGYVVSVSCVPKTSGGFTPAPTGPPGSNHSPVPPTPFVWSGQTSTLTVDTLNPGDG